MKKKRMSVNRLKNCQVDSKEYLRNKSTKKKELQTKKMACKKCKK